MGHDHNNNINNDMLLSWQKQSESCNYTANGTISNQRKTQIAVFFVFHSLFGKGEWQSLVLYVKEPVKWAPGLRLRCGLAWWEQMLFRVQGTKNWELTLPGLA